MELTLEDEIKFGAKERELTGRALATCDSLSLRGRSACEAGRLPKRESGPGYLEVASTSLTGQAWV